MQLGEVNMQLGNGDMQQRKLSKQPDYAKMQLENVSPRLQNENLHLTNLCM